MVYKAAGRLNEYLAKATPSQHVDLFLASWNQRDRHLMAMTLSTPARERIMKQVAEWENLTAVRRISQIHLAEHPVELITPIPLKVHMYRGGYGQEKVGLAFVLVRSVLEDRWEIDAVLPSDGNTP